jgi:hypothetical protein
MISTNGGAQVGVMAAGRDQKLGPALLIALPPISRRKKRTRLCVVASDGE